MNTKINTKIREYWTERSDSYCKMVCGELYGEGAHIWEELIYQQIDKNASLKVLDIGTGPGLFASLMGKNPNYEVFAVDSSEGMLENAIHNAKNFGSKVTFQWADAHDLPFEDDRFDVIVTRNVIWNLPYPEETYKEWKRVLKRGGKMVNFDANWYLRLFNEAKQKEYEKYQGQEVHDGEGIPDGMAERMDAIAEQLPLSQKPRPAWDVNCLLELGFEKMAFDYNINEVIYDKEQREAYSYAPMFMITATK